MTKPAIVPFRTRALSLRVSLRRAHSSLHSTTFPSLTSQKPRIIIGNLPSPSVVCDRSFEKTKKTGMQRYQWLSNSGVLLMEAMFP